MGKIHFPNPDGSVEILTWRAGTTYTEIRDSKRKKHIVSHPDMTGCSWEDFRRTRASAPSGGRDWKKYQHCEVTPALVRKYIEENLYKKAVRV